MYKLFTQAQYDDNGTHRQLVNAVYTDDPKHLHLPTCEGVYDIDTNVKWWQCSTDELLIDDREYKNFLLCQTIDESVDGNNNKSYSPLINVTLFLTSKVILCYCVMTLNGIEL